MTSNEFVFWLKGIVDSTPFMPTKDTWDKISDTLKTVKLNKKESSPLDSAVIRRLTDIQLPTPPTKPNPYNVTCDNKTKPNDIT